jgi:hypothetical protein
MPEILTESFCERCGTRYTFEAAAPSRGRLGRVRVMSRGLRNYILSDESSLEEAFAEARSDDERSVTSQQLDAFHKTFNFCMSCRQYTCANCWNTAEGRCLTCAPHLGQEPLPAPFPNLDPRAGMVAAPAVSGNGHAHDGSPEAWPAADLQEPAVDLQQPAVDLQQPALDEAAVDEAAAAVSPVTDLDALAAAPPAGAAGTGEPSAQRAAAAAAETTAFLARFRPGENLDSALEAYEAEAGGLQAGPPAPDLRPDETAVVAASSLAAAEAAEASAQPLPEAAPVDAEWADAAPSDAASVETATRAAAAAASAGAASSAAEASDATPAEEAPVAPDEVTTTADAEPERPARLAAAAAAWQVVAPDTGEVTPAPSPEDVPAWPPLPPGSEAPQWPTTPAYAPRPASPRGGNDLLWAASSQDVLGQPVATGQSTSAVQPCVSCGLALSATARFCRRCGTRQG